jgi:hypothetical protein
MHISIEVPEIAEYSQGFSQFWLKSLFIQSVSTNYQINALSSTYIRLVEASLVKYQLGTDKLREFWGTHISLNLGAAHRAISHYESCLSDMYRAVNCYRRLRRHRSQDGLAVMLNKEKPAFATDAVTDRFRLMRNEIHHLEALVVKGEIQEGQPFALMPDGPERPHPTEPNQTVKSIDRLIIGQQEVTFAELAEWLREMGRSAEKIATFDPNSNLSPEATAIT